jgi:hypothetical protein
MRRSTVLSLPLQEGFPDFGHTHINLKHQDKNYRSKKFYWQLKLNICREKGWLFLMQTKNDVIQGAG